MERETREPQPRGDITDLRVSTRAGLNPSASPGGSRTLPDGRPSAAPWPRNRRSSSVVGLALCSERFDRRRSAERSTPPLRALMLNGARAAQKHRPPALRRAFLHQSARPESSTEHPPRGRTGRHRFAERSRSRILGPSPRQSTFRSGNPPRHVSPGRHPYARAPVCDGGPSARPIKGPGDGVVADRPCPDSSNLWCGKPPQHRSTIEKGRE